jgi:hypothetical protein
MVGPTPQVRITGLYVAVGASLLALVLVVIVLIRAPAEARQRIWLPLAGFACLTTGLVAIACVRLIGIHAGVDTTNLSLALEFGDICIAGAFYIAMWVRRRADGRGRDD